MKLAGGVPVVDTGLDTQETGAVAGLTAGAVAVSFCQAPAQDRAAQPRALFSGLARGEKAGGASCRFQIVGPDDRRDLVVLGAEEFRAQVASLVK